LSSRFHDLEIWSGILHNLFWDILNGWCGLDLCPFIFGNCRPCLELLEQIFGRWRIDFGLTLIGWFKSRCNFAARRRVTCGRRQVLRVGSGLIAAVD
jgi:hypothetical protein